jgi:hypothetical protein
MWVYEIHFLLSVFFHKFCAKLCFELFFYALLGNILNRKFIK